MTSTIRTDSMQSCTCTNSPLAELRKAAGYRSSKEFAATLGIPATTYSRYERTLANPESSVPLRAAWAIADKLNCSIDAIIGRANDDDISTNHNLNIFYRSLSDSGRTMLDEYVKFLDFRDRVLAVVSG